MLIIDFFFSPPLPLLYSTPPPTSRTLPAFSEAWRQNLTAAQVKVVPAEEQLARGAPSACEDLQTEARTADAANGSNGGRLCEEHGRAAPLRHDGARRGIPLIQSHIKKNPKKTAADGGCFPSWLVLEEKSNDSKELSKDGKQLLMEVIRFHSLYT